MPLPTPNPGEERDEFVSRCMKAQEGEDKPQDQKVAICMEQWRSIKKQEFEAAMQTDEQELLEKFGDGFTASDVLLKVDEENHFVLAPVLVPEEVDRQGDIISEEEIAKAAHQFLADMRERDADTDLQHKFDVNPEQIALVESYVTTVPIDFGNGKVVKSGTWLAGWEIRDPALWTSIVKGQLTGLSIFGVGESEAA